MKQVIKQYALEQGALEIQYIEEFFGEFARKKTATEIVERLKDREHLIHMIEAPLRRRAEPGRSGGVQGRPRDPRATSRSRSSPIW